MSLERQTRALLDEIPTLWAQIQPSHHIPDDGPRPAPGSKPLIDVVFYDLARGIDLWNWCTLAIDEMADQDQNSRLEHAPTGTQPTIEAMCTFLAGNLDWIIPINDQPNCKHTRTCGCFTAAIRDIHHAYQRAAGIRPEQRYLCPACTWQVEPQDGSAWFRCTGCGKTWTLAAEIDRLMAVQESVMTLGRIAAETGIAPRTLRRWAGERFSAVGVRHGRPLYDIRTVRRAAERVNGPGRPKRGR